MRFALIGHPVSHSFSARYLNSKFQEAGINAVYTLIDIEKIEDLKSIIDSSLYNGFNVTIPYKTAVIPYLDSLSPEAQAVGAVNVIQIKGSKTIGHNTDIIGFRNAIAPLLKPYHTKALILGTGGASHAVAYVLQQLGINFDYVSRSNQKYMSYSKLTTEIIREHKLIINTTPLGMSPNVDTAPDIPYHALTNQHLLFDLVYNPAVTRFQSMGMQYGAETCGGLTMLYAQADAACNIWFKSNSI